MAFSLVSILLPAAAVVLIAIAAIWISHR